MPEKTLPLLPQVEWIHVWLAALTALWGGLVSYFRRVQSGHPHSWTSVTMHMAMSGFAGLMCWLGCVQFNVPAPLTAICTGLAGHMGAEFIKIIEDKFEARLNQEFPNPVFPAYPEINPAMIEKRRATDIDPNAPTGPSLGRREGDLK